MFYGSYMHLHARLSPRFPTEIVAGVTGMSGCWSAAGMPIAQGDDVFTVLPATLPEERTGAAARRCGRRRGDEGRTASAETAPRAANERPPAARHLCRARHHGGRENDAARRQARRRRALFCRRAGAGLGASGHERASRRRRLGTGRRALSHAGSRRGAGCRARALWLRALSRSRAGARRARSATHPTIAKSARARPRRCVTRRGGARRHRVRRRSGVFAMAAAVCEEIEAGPESWRALDVTIVPGITAMLAVAARIGAPLGHDFCALSLSDNLKPWDLIERRLDAAASAGFVIALYNPVSRARPWQFARCHRTAAPASAGNDAGRLRPRRRTGGRSVECRRRSMLPTPPQADMATLVIVGSRETRVVAARRAFAARLHAARRRRGQRMIEPRERVFARSRPRRRRCRRPAQHDHLDAESARGGDLAVGGAAAAVFRDHDFDAMRRHQRAVVGFAERPAPGHVSHMRQRQRRIDRIDAADQIICCGASSNGASSLRPSATKTRRGVCPSARTASRTLLTSVQRSPATATHGGRRSATNGTPVLRAASTAFAEMSSHRDASRRSERRCARARDSRQAPRRRQNRRCEPAPAARGRSSAAGERQRDVEIGAAGQALAPACALPWCRRE